MHTPHDGHSSNSGSEPEMQPVTPSCNICGGVTFGPGPGGRTSVNGKAPGCLTCGSLERHRAIRGTLERLASLGFGSRSVLQFSRDQSAKPEWFAAHEVSIYEGDNHLDLTNIDRPDESYDLIICNHVLEHVRDDRAALREMCRILRPDGFAVLSFPDPMRLRETRDWGYPNWNEHGHFRQYGRDVVQKMAEELPNAFILECTTVDPVTCAEDLVYFICRSGGIARHICAALPDNYSTVAHRPESESTATI